MPDSLAPGRGTERGGAAIDGGELTARLQEPVSGYALAGNRAACLRPFHTFASIEKALAGTPHVAI